MNLEVEKYLKCWTLPEYRIGSPAEHNLDQFLKFAKLKESDTVIDFGCGTGRADLELSKFCKVRMLDFTDNCLDPEVRKNLHDSLTFEVHDLTKPIPGNVAEYGLSCDVLEHIPPEDVSAVLDNITKACKRLYLQISCVPDVMGELIGEQLHLTVQPHAWWLERLNELDCVILGSKDYETHCVFYLTRYVCGESTKRTSKVNTDDAVIHAQVLENLKSGLPECRPYEAQDTELIILAGGPSLNDFEDEIRLNKRLGIPVVTVNGAYNWALERGIKPDVQIVLDAREFNTRFVEPIIPSCKYLICSQCHPNLVTAIPRDQITLWHSNTDAVREAVKTLDLKIDIYPVMGGMTVMLRALPLLKMLGFSKFAIYGWDSCIIEDKHHAYAQAENDSPRIVTVECGGKDFKCHGWMLTQAYEFLEISEHYADIWQMDVKGNGLIAHMIKTGAELINKD